MGANSILIVDDEKGIRTTLRSVFEDEGFEVTTASTGEECLEKAAAAKFACILLDVWLPGIDGIKTLEGLRGLESDSAVVMISGHGNIETAVGATKLGAFDFIEKPLSLDRTVITVKNAIRQRELLRVNRNLAERLEGDYEMVGESVSIRALRKQISIVAPTDGRVLISGESGTGKELVARAIHSQSKRAGAPFVEINSAAIPEDLVESELFGHTKGAFSGASRSKKGKFEMADGATLFLDEIGDMSPRVQSKMLRVLEEQRFEPVGSNNPVTVDVRVISATNKPIDKLIENGGFRTDLFYRLNVIPFQVPPLRERIEDIELLAEHFNRRFSGEYGRKAKKLSPELIEKMKNYSWPGNVRELRNTIERLVIMNEDSEIGIADLPPFATADEPLASSYRFPSFKEATDAYQREYILHKLEESGGNVSKAAEAMGVDRSHLYRRMKSLGIEQR